MADYACGFPGCPPKDFVSQDALKISFKLLQYHKDSARYLTFEEYEAIRTLPWIFTDLHETPLYIVEDGKFSALLRVINDGNSLELVHDLKQLLRS